MRTHGWAGRPPRDGVEARARILPAARARLAETGSTTTAEVAEILGVTRQTVYRYFPSTEELLNAAAMDAVTDLVSQLVEHVSQHLADTAATRVTPSWRWWPSSTSTCATTRHSTT